MRPFRLSVFLLILLLVLGTASAALAEKRVALVIGNGQYGRDIGALANPPNDARLVANTLRSLNFEVVETIDGTQKGMKRAIRSFGKILDAAGKDGVGLFYYAGHGVQVQGANYMIPIDAKIETEGDVDLEAINANSVLKMMEFSGTRLSFIILDACRNNPFSRGFRSASRGLARMEAPQGSLLAYATAPGNVAADGKGTNSPYATALVKGMLSGQPVERMFREIRNDVMQQTKKKQTPWESSSLTGGDFFFSPPRKTAGTNSVPQPTTKVVPAIDREALFWQSIQGSVNAADFEAYIAQFPNGLFKQLAMLRLDGILLKEKQKKKSGISIGFIEGVWCTETKNSQDKIKYTNTNGNWSRQYFNDSGMKWLPTDSARLAKMGKVIAVMFGDRQEGRSEDITRLNNTRIMINYAEGGKYAGPYYYTRCD